LADIAKRIVECKMKGVGLFLSLGTLKKAAKTRLKQPLAVSSFSQYD